MAGLSFEGSKAIVVGSDAGEQIVGLRNDSLNESGFVWGKELLKNTGDIVAGFFAGNKQNESGR